MAGWVDPRPNDFSVEGLRARFKSLQDWLSNPEFPNGFRVGVEGEKPTYNPATGVTEPAKTDEVDAQTFRRGTIQSFDELPPLPNPDLPVVIFLTADQKIYRQKDGQWVAEVDAGDLVGEIDPSQIPEDSITANHLKDFSVTAKKFNTASHIIY